MISTVAKDPELMILELERIRNSIDSVVTGLQHYDSKLLLGKPRPVHLLDPSASYNPSNLLAPTDNDPINLSAELAFPDNRKRKKSAENDRLYRSENDINKLFEILNIKENSNNVTKFNRHSLGSQLENDLNSSSETVHVSEHGSLNSFSGQLNITDDDRDDVTPTPPLIFVEPARGANDVAKYAFNVTNNSNEVANHSLGATITPNHSQDLDTPYTLGRSCEQLLDEWNHISHGCSDGASTSFNNSAASQCDMSDDSDIDEESRLLDDESFQLGSAVIYDPNFADASLKPEDMSFRSKAKLFELFHVDDTAHKLLNKNLVGSNDNFDRSISPGEILSHQVAQGESIKTVDAEPNGDADDVIHEEKGEPSQVDSVGYYDSSDDDTEPMFLPDCFNSDVVTLKRKRRRIRPSRYHRQTSTVLEEGQFVIWPDHLECGGMTPTVRNTCSQCATCGVPEFGSGPNVDVMESARGSTGFLCGLRGSNLSLTDSYYKGIHIGQYLFFTPKISVIIDQHAF